MPILIVGWKSNIRRIFLFVRTSDFGGLFMK